MFIDIVKENWKYENVNDEAAVELWNEKAEHFSKYDLEKVQNERLVQIIKEKNLINKQSTILDVGCGAGKYCTALADDCLKAIGTDLSPKMVELAQKRALEYGKQNVEFRCDDWSKLDINKEGLANKFDLVIACMTPAICNYDTFEKFINCSKNAGIFCCGTRRTDSMTDEIYKIIGIQSTHRKSEKLLQYAFNILWEKGYYPSIEYIDQSWDSEMELEKAIKVYVNKCKATHEIDLYREEMIQKYLKEMSKDGIVYEKIKTSKAIIYWEKN